MFEWDQFKEQSNIAKHRLDFRTASRVFLDPFLIEFEDDRGYEETRWNVIGMVVAKLDARRALEITGDLPQNVNYAIKVNYLKLLLELVPEIAKGLRPPVLGLRSFDDVVREATAASVLVVVPK